MILLGELNSRNRAGFVAVCGPLFEHSPWVAERAFDANSFSGRPAGAPSAGAPPGRPLNGGTFPNLDALHTALCDAMYSASIEEQIKLIASHPDLVGRLAKEGRLTRESTTEQTAAGLDRLTFEEAAAFDRYNAAYREKFGFPFVICARENKKSAILSAFPIRLDHDRPDEIRTALAEIAKIARLRLLDAVSKG